MSPVPTLGGINPSRLTQRTAALPSNRDLNRPARITSILGSQKIASVQQTGDHGSVSGSKGSDAQRLGSIVDTLGRGNSSPAPASSAPKPPTVRPVL